MIPIKDKYIEKLIENCRREMSILDVLRAGVKVKIWKARKNKRKYEITSIGKSPIIKESLKEKNLTECPDYPMI